MHINFLKQYSLISENEVKECVNLAIEKAFAVKDFLKTGASTNHIIYRCENGTFKIYFKLLSKYNCNESSLSKLYEITCPIKVRFSSSFV